MPLVSIIIRTKNEERYIGQTLKGVFDQEFSDFEVIIIDSGSKDNTLEIAKRFNVKVFEIKEKTFNHGFAINYGASKSKGDFLVILSGHAIPASKFWLKNLLEGFDEQGIGAVWGRCLPLPGANPIAALDVLRFWGTKKSRWFSNTNSAIRHNVWEKLKFDEKIPYSEDYLWEYSLKKIGYHTRYIPKAVVFHSHNDNFYDCYKRAYAQSLAHTYIEKKIKRKIDKRFIITPVTMPIWVLGCIIISIGYVITSRYIYRIDWYIKVFMYRFIQAIASFRGRAKGLREFK